MQDTGFFPKTQQSEEKHFGYSWPSRGPLWSLDSVLYPRGDQDAVTKGQHCLVLTHTCARGWLPSVALGSFRSCPSTALCRSIVRPPPADLPSCCCAGLCPSGVLTRVPLSFVNMGSHSCHIVPRQDTARPETDAAAAADCAAPAVVHLGCGPAAPLETCCLGRTHFADLVQELPEQWVHAKLLWSTETLYC